MELKDVHFQNNQFNKKITASVSCDKSFLSALKLFRDDLKVAFHKKLKRFMIAHVDKRTKLTRCLTIVEGDDGEFRQPDIRDINYLKKHIMWDLLDHYPDPEDMWQAFDNEEEKKKILAKKKRKEWIQNFIKDRKREWDEAVNKFYLTGKSKDPTDKCWKKQNKKIYDMGHIKQGALYVPITLKKE